MKINDEILRKFCISKEKIRPAMMNPFVIQDTVYATNGYIAIAIPKDYAEEDYSDNPVMDKLPTFFNPIKLFDNPYKINLCETVKNLPKEPIYEVIENTEECPDCYGSGECECSDCGNTHDCGHCDGEGVIGTKTKTDKIIGEQISEGYRIKIDGCFYNPLYIEIISTVADDWDILYIKPTEALTLKNGEIKVLLMPIRYDESSGDYKILGIKTSPIT
jgi:hypothetical protein